MTPLGKELVRLVSAVLAGAVDAVLFDVDGTLTDTIHAIEESMRRALDEFGWGNLGPADLPGMIGKPWQEFAPIMHPQDPLGFRKRFMEISREVQGAKGPFPGIPDVLAQIKDAGYRLGIVTTKSRELTAHLLDRFHLSRYFEACVTADDVRCHKPDPEPVRKAVTALGVLPRRAVMVGDTTLDVTAGRRAGTWTIAVTWGFGSEDELRAAGADFVLRDVPGIAGLLVPRGGNRVAGGRPG